MDIGAKIGDDVDPQAEETALVVHRHFRRHDVVAALGVGHEVLGAVAGPLDRPAEPLRRLEHQRIFAVDEGLGAETAAHVMGQHAQLRGIDLEHRPGDDVAHRVHALRAGGQHEAILVGMPFADGGARLHEVADETVVVEFDAGDMAGFGEGRIGLCLVAEVIFERLVGAEIGPYQGGILAQRIGGAGAGLLVLEIDFDQFGGVLGKRARVGHHEGDGVADIVDAIATQDRNVAGLGPGAVGLLLHGAGLEVAEMADVVAGQHQMHARRVLRGLGRADGEGPLGDRRA